MSDEKIEKGKQPDAAAKKKVKRRNPIAKWFRELKSELKKVVWPTPKQITNNTLVSLAVMVSAAIVVWGVDQVGATIIQALRSVFAARG
ncbi:MAG: preprotein translocase subunit SecE [Oscillospiraceae bacterium]|jgi:preprotein translocase subunit SecE|nr:preprotein translocase subunit SecE [Oscillospiraceae bacterium]